MGIGTDPAAFREAGVPAGFLATLGVVITAGVVAGAAWLVMDTEPTTASLLGSVVASTDAAAVFTAAAARIWAERSGCRVDDNRHGRGLERRPGVADWALFLVLQFGVGVFAGLVMGAVGRWIVARVTGAAASSLGVVTLAIAALSYGGAAVLGGSAFLRST